jgi:hypothetical protein
MARVFAVILVAKKSRQKGLSPGLLDGCKLRADNRIVLISTTVESLYYSTGRLVVNYLVLLVPVQIKSRASYLI